MATDTPFGGPHTPTNLKLVGFAAVSCIVLLTIARINRLSALECALRNERKGNAQEARLTFNCAYRLLERAKKEFKE